MLNKFLIICSLTIGSLAGLHAEEELPPVQESNLACAKCEHEEGQKDLTPGALVCNASEDRCVKEEGDKEETSSSSLFAVFCEDHEDEENLLACKDCQ